MFGYVYIYNYRYICNTGHPMKPMIFFRSMDPWDIDCLDGPRWHIIAFRGCGVPWGTWRPRRLRSAWDS